MKLTHLHWQEYQNKEEGKDHESIQSSTTHDPGHRMEKRYKTQENITYKKAKSPPPLRKFKEQFKKSSFIIQEQDSRTGHELLFKCSRTAQEHFMNVKLDYF